MPPKASHRRSARVSSREPEPARERPGQFARPHLPALHGTPSSRRQYSYGSALEPPPRPGAGLHRIDISNAVTEALTRSNDEIDDGAFVRPPKPRVRTNDDTEEDELAQDAGANRRTGGAQSQRNAAPLTTARTTATLTLAQQSVAGSDADSQRSFGIESDFYGDATIRSASTPETTPPEPLYPNLQIPAPRFQNLPAERLPDVSTEASQTRPTDAAKTRAGRSGAGQRVGKTLQQQSRPPISQRFQDDEEEDDQEQESEQTGLKHGRAINTPMPKRGGLRSSRAPGTLGPLRNEPEVSNPPDSRDQSSEEEVGNAHVARTQTLGTRTTTDTLRLFGGPAPEQTTRQQSVEAQQPQGSRKTLSLDRPSRDLFAQAAEARRAPRLGEQFFTEQSGQEAAIQRELREAEDQIAREARDHDAALRRAIWMRRWAWFKSLFSLDPLRTFLRDRQPRRWRTNNEEEDEDEEELVTNWWQLLNPLTYLQALIYLFDTIMDRFVRLVDNISPPQLRGTIPRPGNTFRWICLGLFASIAGMGLLSLLSGVSLPDVTYRPGLPRVSLPNFGGITEKIGSIIPNKPWWTSDYDFDDLWEVEDDDREETRQLFKQYDQKLRMLNKNSKLHQDSLDKIQKAMPEFVHMDFKHGKPSIPQDLWYAIKDWIHADKDILTMTRNGGTYQLSSEDQLQALIAQIASSPAFRSNNTAEIDRTLEIKMPSVLEAWIKNNNDKVAGWLGPALGEVPSAGLDRDMKNQITKLIKDRLRSDDLDGIVVSRDEFMRYVKDESAAIKKDVHAELEALQPKLKELIRETVRMTTQDTPQGMSKTDVESLVNNLIRKAFADMNLEAMAKGKIYRHWDADLKNQVNFFAIGSGAIIDGYRVSPTYDPHQKAISDDDFRKGLRGIYPFPALAALEPWQDEGDCWCGAHVTNRRGNFKGVTLPVQLSQLIIPQHIVIEHILPGATLDPDARPKDIEVWAAFDDELWDRAADFSATHFPDDDPYWRHNPPEYDTDGAKFVKIGQLKYEGAELHDGIHVHRLSKDLEDFAATDQIILRAISNYGSETHTCFYRARVFGQLSPQEISRPE